MFFAGDEVRLKHPISDLGLAAGATCRVAHDVNAQEDAVKIKWHTETSGRVAMVPLDAVELILSTATEQRTAVFWALQASGERLIQDVLKAMLDRGLVSGEGLNVARLHYISHDRWWKRGDPVSHSSLATLEPWDGYVIAFSGEARFHLEFRLKGTGPTVLLHERDAIYGKQVQQVEAAMNLARLLMVLAATCCAGCCAFPVADPWLTDEDWSSLLRPPYYPDFFLLPPGHELQELPAQFRTARLSNGGSMITDLPVKFAPHDAAPIPSERDLELGSLRKCKSLGEKYYDQLYEAPRLGTAGLYSSAKDSFHDAISQANRLGLKAEAEALEQRLQDIKGVFRSQFSR